MNGETEKPKRAFTLAIEISGDTWDDVLRDLAELASHIPEHGEKCGAVSGGYSSGYWVHITRNLEMTHERYAEALDRYLAAPSGTE